MFLHLGGDTIIMSKDLVAIIDFRTIKDKEPYTKECGQGKSSKFIGGSGKSKSMIITNDTVYFSPISASTLKKRADNILTWINGEE